MKVPLYAFFIVMLVSITACNSVNDKNHSVLPKLNYAVGMTNTEIQDNTRQRKLPLSIWYPAQGSSEPRKKTSSIYFSYYGSIDAEPAKGNFPVVLLSHGTGGTASSLLWIAEYLAGNGYWVVGADHPNDSWPNATAEGLVRVWDRPQDLSEILSQLQQDPRYKPYIDFNRAAALGHSSGGYTALALVGARYDNQLLAAHCQSSEAMPACGLVDRNAKPEIDFSKASDDYSDKRIKAVVSLAPAVNPALTEASLRRVDTPVLLITSEQDELLANTPSRSVETIPTANLIPLKQAGHFVYLAECNSLGEQMVEQICVDPDTVNRFSIHQQLQPQILDFLNHQLH